MEMSQTSRVYQTLTPLPAVCLSPSGTKHPQGLQALSGESSSQPLLLHLMATIHVQVTSLLTGMTTLANWLEAWPKLQSPEITL